MRALPGAPEVELRVPGLLRHLAGPNPVSVEEMNEAIRRHVRKKFEDAVRR